MKIVYCVLPVLAIAFGLTSSNADEKAGVKKKRSAEKVMQVHYLEIVTKDVDAVCASYEAVTGVKFSEWWDAGCTGSSARDGRAGGTALLVG